MIPPPLCGYGFQPCLSRTLMAGAFRHPSSIVDAYGGRRVVTSRARATLGFNGGCGVCSSFSAARRVAGPVVLCAFALVGRVKGLRYCAAPRGPSVCAFGGWWRALCEIRVALGSVFCPRTTRAAVLGTSNTKTSRESACGLFFESRGAFVCGARMDAGSASLLNTLPHCHEAPLGDCGSYAVNLCGGLAC